MMEKSRFLLAEREKVFHFHEKTSRMLRFFVDIISFLS